jgi:outer membrane protein assembly factor BamB
VVWKVNVVRATAVVTTTDFIYAGQSGSKTTLIAFDAITGKKVWEFIPNAAANTSAYSSPFVSDGIVYIAGADKNMYAVDAKTGVKVWEYLTNTTTYPTSANGVLYCTGNEGIFYALDAKNGTKKWSVNLTNTGLSTPVVVNNIVYTSSTTSGTSGVVYALDAATGQTKWKQASNVTSSDVCVANDLVFITNGDYGITALDANTGIVKWKVGDSKNAANANKQTILDGILYTAVYNSSSIIAMDAKTGERKWITNLGTTGSSGSPIGADGLIYHVDSKYTCYAIDGVTGTIKWSVANLDFVDFNPVVVNNLIYTKSEALDAKTGASKLKFARIATTGDLAFWINGKAYHSSRSGSVQ